MTALPRPEAEARIAKVLLDQWDPLSVHEAPGEHHEYDLQTHTIYDLLARGASDIQVERLLRHVEKDVFGHAELATRDIKPVIEALRELERTII